MYAAAATAAADRRSRDMHGAIAAAADGAADHHASAVVAHLHGGGDADARTELSMPLPFFPQHRFLSFETVKLWCPTVPAGP